VWVRKSLAKASSLCMAGPFNCTISLAEPVHIGPASGLEPVRKNHTGPDRPAKEISIPAKYRHKTGKYWWNIDRYWQMLYRWNTGPYRHDTGHISATDFMIWREIWAQFHVVFLFKHTQIDVFYALDHWTIRKKERVLKNLIKIPSKMIFYSQISTGEIPVFTGPDWIGRYTGRPVPVCRSGSNSGSCVI